MKQKIIAVILLLSFVLAGCSASAPETTSAPSAQKYLTRLNFYSASGKLLDQYRLEYDEAGVPISISTGIMQDEIDQLERSYDGCEDISLVGVQVTMNQLGKGTVIEQDMNRIKVAFEGLEKTYILDKKFIARPKFENDEEVVSAFTVYARARERISFLETQIASLEK